MSRIREALGSRLISETPKYSKNTGLWKWTKYVARCPVDGCQNTVSISKVDHINGRCREHALIDNEDRSKWGEYIYSLHTRELKKTRIKISEETESRFLCEEVGIQIGKEPIYRILYRCSSVGCNNTTVDHRRTCFACANAKKQKRPYERTYNRATSRSTRTKNKGSIHIKWLLSYEEFVTLCDVKNCHYCNDLLNRAKYKSKPGSDAILLDRKDSNLSYTNLNCVPCCAKCNDTKGEHISYEEMILIMKHRGLWVHG